MAKQLMKLGKFWLLLAWVVVFAIQCKTEVKKPEIDKTLPIEKTVVKPNFSADSAYQYIQTQVDFGPRVPGTDAHKKCAEWLAAQLESFGASVTVQKGQVLRYDNVKMPMYNIVGSFNPTAKKRLLLCAHWDTRHVADQGSEDINQPIDGANDGGSGVGVLLEIARQLQLKTPNAGVDIIFFDVEDQGQPDYITPMKKDTYCLGSQYWAKSPHVPGYMAQNGILLDMVGAKDAVFTLEGTSMYFAPEWMRKVWDKAIELGHSKYFNYSRTDPITDDHLYINQIKGIPTIDIIQYDRNTRSGFGAYWHTHDDNMEVIDKATLQAVGETVLAITYEY